MDIRSYFSRAAPPSKRSEKAAPEQSSRKRLRKLDDDADDDPASPTRAAASAVKKLRVSSSPRGGDKSPDSKPKSSGRRILDDSDDDDNDEEEKADVVMSDGGADTEPANGSSPASKSPAPKPNGIAKGKKSTDKPTTTPSDSNSTTGDSPTSAASQSSQSSAASSQPAASPASQSSSSSAKKSKQPAAKPAVAAAAAKKKKAAGAASAAEVADFFSPRKGKPKKKSAPAKASSSSSMNGVTSSTAPKSPKPAAEKSTKSPKSQKSKKPNQNGKSVKKESAQAAASSSSAAASSSSSSAAASSSSSSASSSSAMEIDDDESNMKNDAEDEDYESDYDSDASAASSRASDDDMMVDEDGDEKPKKRAPPKKQMELKPSVESGKKLPRDRLKSNYHPIDDAGWKAGEPVPYLELARSFAQIEDISGRLKTIEVMANLFRSVIALTPGDLLPVIYLCTNKIAPPYENLEIGVGDSLLFKALQMSTGRKLSQLRLDAEETGDLGIIAERSRGQQMLMFRPKPLSCEHVFKSFKTLSQTEGNKSRDKKVGLINKLFVAARESEARFVVRSLQGKMRIGFSEQSVLVALARACALTPPAQKVDDPSKMVLDTRKNGTAKFQQRMAKCEEIIKEVYSEVPNWDMVVPALIDTGIDELQQKCFLTPGIPIKAMLAKPTKGISEILERFAKLLFTLEFKYDGERIQIHLLPNGEFAFFSRNAESSTAKYPDIQKDLNNHFDTDKIKSFIIDCEVVAFDIKKEQILPFQTLSTRKRKDVKTEDIEVQVCLYAFDCLYLNGESLLKKPFEDRRTALHETFVEKTGKFMFAKHKDTADPEDIQQFLDLAIASSCEGLMVKTLREEATYEPSKRSRSWLKVKKDYLSGVGDTFDLVPIGAYHGRGKRTGTYGAYLVACYDTENEEYQAICKIGTGLSDEFLASSTKFFVEGNHLIPKPPRYYKLPASEIDDPHVWFEPAAVWEIKCADLSISPKYFAGVGLVHETKGIALRFPRFIRIRDDKQPDEATSAEQVADMYRNQSVVNANNGGGPPRR